MIGNHDCDPACNNAKCSWDGLDCGCAPGCSTSDYGSCKEECLVPDCNYDSMKGYASCNSSLSVTAAEYYQLLNRTFNATFSYAKLCLAQYPACTWDKFQMSLYTCQSACDNFQCLFSFGRCAGVSPVCEAPVSNSNMCLNCGHSMNYFTDCVSECPSGYYAHPLVHNLCYPMADNSTEANPQLYYVDNNASATSNGHGTLGSPFHSIAVAFAAINQNYVNIILLPGTHILASDPSSAYLRSGDVIYYSGSTSSSAAVNIKGSQTYTSCSKKITLSAYQATERPVVQYNNQDQVRFITCGHLSIQNIDFDANTSLVSNCSSALCYFCPYTYTDPMDGILKFDTNQPVENTTYALSSYCQAYASTAFITANTDSLAFTNVSFANFRQGFGSLIAFGTGNVVLSNVEFYNIRLSELLSTAVIVQWNYDFTPSSASILFVYDSGSVTLIGNGFEYTSTITLQPFFRSQSLGLVSISNVYFGYNFAPIGLSASTDENQYLGSLILLDFVLQLQVTNCTFDHNMVGNGLIRLYSTHFKWTNLITSEALISLMAQDNIIIRDCAFRNNTGRDGSAVAIQFEADLQNVLIENCMFSYELAIEDGVIEVENYANLDSTAKVGGQKVVIDASGNRYKAYFPPSRVTIRNVTFNVCACDEAGVVYFDHIANVILSDISILGGLDAFPTNFYQTTLQAFTLRPDTYMRLNWDQISSGNCSAGMSISNSYNFTLLNSLISAAACGSGLPGLAFSQMSGGVHINSTTFSRTIGNNIAGTAVQVSSSQDYLSLDEVQVMNCINLNLIAGGQISVQGSPISVLIGNSGFISNIGMTTAVIYIRDATSLRIGSSNFDSNVVTQASSAGTLDFVATTSSAVTITNCLFKRNAALLLGGALLFDGNGVNSGVTLNILNSKFIENLSKDGFAIAFGSSLTFTQLSTIDNCVFASNSGRGQGAISLLSQTGVLAITSSTFTGNTGKTAAIYADYFENTTLFPSKLILSNVTFSSNTGSAIFRLGNPDHVETFVSDRVLFYNNTGICLYLTYSNFVSENSVFLDNSGSTSPVVYETSNSTVNFTNSVFRGNIATVSKAGVGLIGTQSTFICLYCTFENNSAFTQAGVVFLEQNSILNISNSVFRANTAVAGGSALYFLGCQTESLIESSVFSNNTGGGDGTIVLISAYLKVSSVTMEENQSLKVSPGIILNLSTLIAQNSKFLRQESVSGSFLYVTTESTASVYGCTFDSAIASSSGGGIIAIQSDLYIESCSFSNLSAPVGSIIFAYSHCVVTILLSTFSDFAASSTSGGGINLYESDLTLQSSAFSSFANTSLVAEKSSMSVSGSTFRGKEHLDGSGSQGGAIMCTNCYSALIDISKFQSLQADTGGAIWVIGNTNSVLAFQALTCVFLNNSASNAGAIYANNVNAQLSYNVFTANKATASNGSGGGVGLYCPNTALTCNYTVTLNTFAGNIAGSQGGGIAWEDVMPTFVNNSFYANSAVYGKDVASFAIRLAPFSMSSRALSADIALTKVASGQIYTGMIELALIDHYGDVVTIDNNSTAELAPTNSTTTISGNWKVTANNGFFLFSDFIISESPGNATNVHISTTGVDTNKKVRSGDGLDYVSVVNISVAMRFCTIGESQVNKECVVCGQGMYSLNPNLTCQDCPSSAICYGNYTMVPRSGYWRSNNLTSNFLSCPNPPACTGSPASPLSLTGLCAEGYEGNLCQSCAVGYSRASKNECSLCPNPYVNAVRLLGIAGATLIAVIILVKSSIASAYKPKALHSVYLKIFMNYLQLVMLTASFNLSWPSFVLDLFSVQESAGGITEQVFSIDCFINSTSSSDVFFDKLVIMAFVPPMLFSVSSVVWLGVAIWRRKSSYLRNELLASGIILFFVAHPSVVKVMFAVFSCQEIDPGELWVASQLNIQCWSGRHLQYSLIVALPSIIIWGIGIPSVCLLALSIEQSNFYKLETKIKFGFLMNGYVPNQFYWEFVILYRKLVIICISVFLSRISVPIQALAIMGVLVIVVVLQHRHQPFQKKSLNSMEMRSILVAAVTIYCGLYYLTNDLDEISKILLFAIIVIMNAFFLLTWMKKMFGIGLIFLLRKIPCLGRVIKVKSDETVRLNIAGRDYFEEEVQACKSRTTVPPASMKDLYFAYIKVPRREQGQEEDVQHQVTPDLDQSAEVSKSDLSVIHST